MLRIALASSLIALASAPSSAQDQAGPAQDGRRAPYTKAAAANTAPRADAVMVSAPSLRIWSAKLFRSLGRAMRYPRNFSNELPHEGLAWVRFACSDDGVPSGIELARGSGNRKIDKAALDAVRRIKTLHPLAAGVRQDQVYVAAMIFASSPESSRRQARAFREQLAARAYSGPRREAALVIRTRPAMD